MHEEDSSPQPSSFETKPGQSIADLKSELERAGPDLNLYFALGRAQSEAGDLVAARDTFEKAVAFSPAAEQAYVLLAGVHRLLDEIDQAEKTLRSGLEHVPGSKTILMELGWLLVAFNRLGEAQYVFQTALTEHRGDIDCWIAAAKVALARGHLETARKYLMRSMAAVKVHDQVSPMRAELERREGNLAAAFNHAELALKKNRRNGAAALQAVGALFESGSFLKGADWLDRFEKKAMITDVGRIELLQILIGQGQFNLAQGYFRTKLFPRVADVPADLLASLEQIAVKLLAAFPDEEILQWLEQRSIAPDARPRLKTELAELYLVRAKPGPAGTLARQILESRPDDSVAWICLAEAECLQGHLKKAEDAVQTALKLNPKAAKAQLILAQIALYRGQKDLALTHADLAVDDDPTSQNVIAMRGELKLRLGCFSDGWHDFSHRLPEQWMAPKRRLPRPKAGSLSACAGKRIFVWAEWGLGEQILFAPLAHELAQHCDQVILECQPRLQKLLATSFPDLEVRPEQGPDDPAPDDYNLHIQLSDLAAWFRTTEQAFPQHQGYLRAPSDLMGEANQALSYVAEDEVCKKLGISWGSTGVEADLKSIPARIMLDAWSDKPVTLINLQHGPERALPPPLEDAVVTFTDPAIDPASGIEGLAALISQLDHVVTVSNTVAHIAGALGKPCDVLVPKYRRTLWHWLDNRSDSPWYPSVTVHFFESDKDATAILKEIAGLVCSP